MSKRIALVLALMTALAAGVVVSAQRSGSAMVTAANAFLASLTPEQRALVEFPLDSDERTRWNFIPDEAFPRNGIQMKALTPAQRRLAHDLLKTGLSPRGYTTYNGIMELEAVLKVVEEAERAARRGSPAPGAAPAPTAAGGARAGGGRGGPAGPGAQGFNRDPLHHHLSIFGTPGPDTVWGWRLEGHHVSLHFTVVRGRLVRAAPTFAGTNPAEVKDGKQKGLRVLGEQEDAARAFLKSLAPDQQKAAIVNASAPNDIVTGNRVKIDPLAPAGIQSKALDPEHRLQLMNVVKSFSGLMNDEIAAERVGRIYSAGVDNVWFAWAGGTERGEKHYFRIQGPTFLIEFDNTQNDGNHVHSVWRDFNGDFGADILREHLATAHASR
jgi:hypothetical protein